MSYQSYAQVSGIEATVSMDGIEIDLVFGGPYYNPLGPTIWTDPDGNVTTCNGICGVDGGTEGLKPGRYCVTIEAHNLSPDAECEHDFATISKCFDVVGSTCPELTGKMDESVITCLSDDTGFVTWNGELAPCLQGNAIFEWTTGDSNDHPDDPAPTTLNNLPPGKYCVKITPYNTMGDQCMCEGYFCTEIGSIEAEPLVIEATITPIVMCYLFGRPWRIISKGFITVNASGGAGFGYSYRWIGDINGDSGMTVPPGNEVQKEYKYCIEVTDACDNKSIKCFQIPIRRLDCGFEEDKEPEEPNDDGGGLGKLNNQNDTNKNLINKQSDLSELDINNQLLITYPNPTIDQLTVEFTLIESRMIKYQVFTVTGKNVLQSKVESTKGLNRLKLNLSDLDVGVYYLKLDNYELKKIIVIQ